MSWDGLCRNGRGFSFCCFRKMLDDLEGSLFNVQQIGTMIWWFNVHGKRTHQQWWSIDIGLDGSGLVKGLLLDIQKLTFYFSTFDVSQKQTLHAEKELEGYFCLSSSINRLQWLCHLHKWFDFGTTQARHKHATRRKAKRQHGLQHTPHGRRSHSIRRSSSVHFSCLCHGWYLPNDVWHCGGGIRKCHCFW